MSTDKILQTKLKLDFIQTDATWEVWEYKTLNMHRGVLVWRPGRTNIDLDEMAQQVRQKVKESYRPGWLRGFAFGVVVMVAHQTDTPARCSTTKWGRFG